MTVTFQYNTINERYAILEQNQDKFLIEEQNITSGNFLVFSDTPRLEDNIQDIKNNTDMILLKQEGNI